MLVEGMALGSPHPTIAATHRLASEVAAPLSLRFKHSNPSDRGGIG